MCPLKRPDPDDGNFSVWLLLIVATLGNVLGSLVNRLLGASSSIIVPAPARPWFPVSPAKLDAAGDWYRRYGKWSLLLSWAPVSGDSPTVVAGVLREPPPRFCCL